MQNNWGVTFSVNYPQNWVICTRLRAFAWEQFEKGLWEMLFQEAVYLPAVVNCFGVSLLQGLISTSTIYIVL